MKYVIMADGKGSRWNNYNNIPKHLIKIGDETLLERTVRLLKQEGITDIVITSHDKRYEVEGATRFEPNSNKYEIDRYTEELITEPICFLYGDTYYSEDAISKIASTDTDNILFFGNEETIIAVKAQDYEMFKYHVDTVRNLYIDGKINKCVGWQVYQSMMNLPFDEKIIADNYIKILDYTDDFDTPDDYEEFIRRK